MDRTIPQHLASIPPPRTRTLVRSIYLSIYIRLVPSSRSNSPAMKMSSRFLVSSHSTALLHFRSLQFVSRFRSMQALRIYPSILGNWSRVHTLLARSALAVKPGMRIRRTSRSESQTHPSRSRKCSQGVLISSVILYQPYSRLAHSVMTRARHCIISKSESTVPPVRSFGPDFNLFAAALDLRSVSHLVPLH